METSKLKFGNTDGIESQHVHSESFVLSVRDLSHPESIMGRYGISRRAVADKHRVANPRMRKSSHPRSIKKPLIYFPFIAAIDSSVVQTAFAINRKLTNAAV